MMQAAMLDIIQEELSGVYVRAENMLDDVDWMRWEIDPEIYEREYPIRVPFAVLVYESGLDYDEDGNAYFDDYPFDYPHSFHRTKRGAELEAMWLIGMGFAESRITIVEDYHLAEWEAAEAVIRD